MKRLFYSLLWPFVALAQPQWFPTTFMAPWPTLPNATNALTYLEGVHLYGDTMLGPLATLGLTNVGGMTNTGKLYVGGDLLLTTTNVAAELSRLATNSTATAFVQTNVLNQTTAPPIAANINAVSYVSVVSNLFGLDPVGYPAIVYTRGFASSGDGGGAMWTYSTTNLFTSTNVLSVAGSAGFWINKRVLEDRVIDIRECGAIPNDGVDDSAAIQSAFDAASAFYNASLAQWGYRCVVEFPAGRWDMGNGVATYTAGKDDAHGIVIRGAGKEATYLVTGRTTGTPMVYLSGASTATVSGITFLGNGGTYTETPWYYQANGLHLYNINYFDLQDLLFRYLSCGLVLESWDNNYGSAEAKFITCNVGVHAIRAQAGIYDFQFNGCGTSVYGVIENATFRQHTQGSGWNTSTPFGWWLAQGRGVSIQGGYGESHNNAIAYALGTNHSHNVQIGISGTTCNITFTNVHIFGTTNRIGSVVLSGAATGADGTLLNKSHTLVAGEPSTNKITVTLGGSLTGDYSGVTYTATYPNTSAILNIDGVTMDQTTVGSASLPVAMDWVTNPKLNLLYRGSSGYPMPVSTTTNTINLRLSYLPLSYGKNLITGQDKLLEYCIDPFGYNYTNTFSTLATYQLATAEVTPGFRNIGKSWSFTGSGGNGWFKGDYGVIAGAPSFITNKSCMLGVWLKATATDALLDFSLRNAADDADVIRLPATTLSAANTWEFIWAKGKIPVMSSFRLYGYVADGQTITLGMVSLTVQDGFTDYERVMHLEQDFRYSYGAYTRGVALATPLASYALPSNMALFYRMDTGATTNYTAGLRTADGYSGRVPRWRGTSSAAPANPCQGDFYKDSDDNKLYYCADGATWEALN